MKTAKRLLSVLIACAFVISPAYAAERDAAEGGKDRLKKFAAAERVGAIVGHFRKRMQDDRAFADMINKTFDFDRDGKLSDEEVKNAILLGPGHMPPPFMSGPGALPPAFAGPGKLPPAPSRRRPGHRAKAQAGGRGMVMMPPGGEMNGNAPVCDCGRPFPPPPHGFFEGRFMPPPPDGPMPGHFMPPPPHAGFVPPPFVHGHGASGPFAGPQRPFPPHFASCEAMPGPGFGGRRMMPPPPFGGERDKMPVCGCGRPFPPPPHGFGGGRFMPPPPDGPAFGHFMPPPFAVYGMARGRAFDRFDGRWPGHAGAPPIEKIVEMMKKRMEKDHRFSEFMFSIFDSDRDGRLDDKELAKAAEAKRFFSADRAMMMRKRFEAFGWPRPGRGTGSPAWKAFEMERRVMPDAGKATDRQVAGDGATSKKMPVSNDAYTEGVRDPFARF